MSGYNGWSNWETWNYKLWMDEQGETNYMIERIEEEKMTVDDVAGMLVNMAWEKHDEINKTSGFFNDVASNAIRVVDFNEIAESIMESVKVA
jgi:hypothetical protein